MTLATKITLLRIILIPIFVLAFYFPPLMMYGFSNVWYFFAFIMFIFLSITDWLDGYIARTYNQISDLGKFLDPLADKILVSSAMIMLLTINLFPAWAIIAMLVREFIVAGIRMIAASEGIVIAADMAGKIKTVLQMLALVSALFILSFGQINATSMNILNIQYIILTIMTLYSGFHYIKAYTLQKKEH
ncbi:MAG: CDP-diacylglycerol--glycerol-3-phosphate 3-phosphatidyltransferase [Culicoidibacterales bacterium]